MTMQHWDPMSEIRRMEDMFNRMWKGRGYGLHDGETFERWGIPMDVIEEPNEIVVKASLPAIKPEDIDVTIEDGVLTLKGETKAEHEEKNKNYLMKERAYGTFYRELRLPQSVDTDKVQTRFENGVLTLNFPKLESKKAKQLKIGANGNVIEGKK